jgi:hypothetical protein
MKKIIGIVIATLVFSNIGFAEMKFIEGQQVSSLFMRTVCIDGYKFVVVTEGGTGIVQAFREADGRSVPAKC